MAVSPGSLTDSRGATGRQIASPLSTLSGLAMLPPERGSGGSIVVVARFGSPTVVARVSVTTWVLPLAGSLRAGIWRRDATPARCVPPDAGHGRASPVAGHGQMRSALGGPRPGLDALGGPRPGLDALGGPRPGLDALGGPGGCRIGASLLPSLGHRWKTSRQHVVFGGTSAARAGREAGDHHRVCHQGR